LDIAKIKTEQIKSFCQLKNTIELEQPLDDNELKVAVRKMIDLGLELEEAQANMGIRIIVEPIDLLRA